MEFSRKILGDFLPVGFVCFHPFYALHNSLHPVSLSLGVEEGRWISDFKRFNSILKRIFFWVLILDGLYYFNDNLIDY